MTTYIYHRKNKITELEGLNPEWGIEIDLRASKENGAIILAHDPWHPGDLFESWLQVFRAKKTGGPLVLNIKECGIEKRVLELMAEFKIESYFFLDSSIPITIEFAVGKKESRFAVRLSSYESLEQVLSWRDWVDWVWIDCFNGTPVPLTWVNSLKPHFKLCLVSPELQGVAVDRISEFKDLGRSVDAICTKTPEQWISQYAESR